MGRARRKPLQPSSIRQRLRMHSNRVDSRAVLIGDVRFGSSNIVEAGAVIVGPIEIGDENYFGPNCVVGAPAQDEVTSDALLSVGLQGTSGGLVSIGNRNVFREFVTVHRGLTGITVVGDDCYLMAYSHIAHDVVLRNQVKIANTVQLGGYCWIGRGAYLGLSSSLHQFLVVGAHSMIGMGSILTRATPPGSLAYGNPARLVRPNSVALERLGISRTDWWEKLRDGEQKVGVPEILAEDYAEFSAAVARAAELRTSVKRWRDAKLFSSHKRSSPYGFRRS